MKNIFVFWVCFFFNFSSFNLCAQKTESESWTYNINIELKDSTLFVNLSLKTIASKTYQNHFLLFNRNIHIEEVLQNDKPLKYIRSSDTIYFESFQKEGMTLFMKYAIPCSMMEYSRIINSNNDSSFIYPVIFDSNQIFCERFNRWYPLLYDNFANFNATIIIPKTHKVFAYYPEADCSEIDGKYVYSFTCYDEDFPLFFTPTNIFQQHKITHHNNTKFDFYFLSRPRRLVAIKDNKPVYIHDLIQIDSLLNKSINRSIAAIDWYNLNLWNKEIKNLHFVETSILGLGVGLGSFILMDRKLMNMEAIENYALSHEISHIWLGIHTEYHAKGKFFIGESIPEYINLLYYESWAGQDAFEKAIQKKINLKLFDVPFYKVTFEQVLNQRKGESISDEIIYHKAVAFVHEFKNMVGKDKFFKIIRETYSMPNHFVTLKDFENNIKANDCWNEYLKLYEMKL